MFSSDIFSSPLLAFDNSEISLEALKVFKSMQSKFEKSYVLHVCNSRKTYLLTHMKGSYIQQFLQKQLPENTKIEVKERGKKTVNGIILESFISSKSSILLLGFVGTKGFKPRSQDLSSRIRQFVYDSKTTLAIVKRPPIDSNTVIFCCDGSEVSLNGLEKTIQFCKNFGKNLQVLHVSSQNMCKYSKSLKNRLKDLLSKYSISIQLVFQNGDLAGYLKDHVEGIQWVILNKNGYRGQITKKRFIGSNTTNVLVNVNCNLILFE